MNQINFQITGNCNMYCDFCSDAVSYQKESSIQDIKHALKRLIDQGLKKIHITGGEPLLYKDLKEVLRYLKEFDVEVSLSTNGVLLPFKKDILVFIDEMVLPLDAVYSKTLIEMGRDQTQPINTVENVYRIKETFPQIKIKVSTVLNKQNVKEITNIVDVVSHLPIEEWEIHQFLPHGRGKKNIQKFLLDDREFEEISLFLKTMPIGEKITTISAGDKIGTEWIITPSLYMIQLKEDSPRFYGMIDELGDLSIRDIVNKPLQKAIRYEN